MTTDLLWTRSRLDLDLIHFYPLETCARHNITTLAAARKQRNEKRQAECLAFLCLDDWT